MYDDQSISEFRKTASQWLVDPDLFSYACCFSRADDPHGAGKE
jgi:hypothetical protein